MHSSSSESFFLFFLFVLFCVGFFVVVGFVSTCFLVVDFFFFLGGREGKGGGVHQKFLVLCWCFPVKPLVWGQNSSAGSALGSLSSGRGDIFLGVNSDSSFPKNSNNSINWDLVCAHMCLIAWTKKILTFMSKTDECQQQKHPACIIHEDEMWLLLSMDYKMVTYAKISPNMVNPKDKAGNAEEEEATGWSLIFTFV